MNWRRLFPLIFLFSCVDGFISNRLYPAKLPFLLKDIFILVVYLFFFITREPGRHWIFEFKRSIGPGNWYLSISLMLLGMLQIFNRGVPSLEVGILGFKTMFFYWPLAILAYAYIDSLERLERFMKAIVYLSVAICIFGIYQFFQDQDFMVRVFGQGFKRAIIMTGGASGTQEFLRVFGTFSSTGAFTQFLVINTMFIFGLLFTARNRPEKSIMVGCLVLNYLTLLATGSRAGLLLLFITAFIFIILCRWLWRTFFIILLLSISLSFGFRYLGKSVLHRFETVKDIEMIKGRTVENTAVIFKMYLEEYPFGRGLGTGSVSSRHLTWGETSLGIQLIENYPSKLQYELGLVGVVLFYLLVFSLIIHWIRHWLKSLDRQTHVFIAALTSFCWAMFFASLFAVIDSPPTGIFLWVLVGMVAKLAALLSNAGPFIQEETYAVR